jgi:hypothetical protein
MGAAVPRKRNDDGWERWNSDVVVLIKFLEKEKRWRPIMEPIAAPPYQTHNVRIEKIIGFDD